MVPSDQYILLMYQLLHPLTLLANPPQKETFKKLVKAKVIDYWEQLLRAEASYLPSLTYFKPQYCSLTKPHKLWTFCGGNPYEVSKARIQLLFLASQYTSGHLTRHWSKDNPSGYCSFPPCNQNQIVETTQHILLMCPAFTKIRQKMFSMCLSVSDSVSLRIITNVLFRARESDSYLMQLLLDCSSLPEVIAAAQLHGDQIFADLFYIGRNWCFCVHREHLKRLGKWNFQS